MTEEERISYLWSQFRGKIWYYTIFSGVKNLRMVVTDNGKRLEMLKHVEVHFNKPVWRNSDWTVTDEMDVWFEVPEISEEDCYIGFRNSP